MREKRDREREKEGATIAFVQSVRRRHRKGKERMKTTEEGREREERGGESLERKGERKHDDYDLAVKLWRRPLTHSRAGRPASPSIAVPHGIRRISSASICQRITEIRSSSEATSSEAGKKGRENATVLARFEHVVFSLFSAELSSPLEIPHLYRTNPYQTLHVNVILILPYCPTVSKQHLQEE